MDLQAYMRAHLRLHMRDVSALQTMQDADVSATFVCSPPPVVSFDVWREGVLCLCGLEGPVQESAAPSDADNKAAIDAIRNDPALRGIVKVGGKEHPTE